MQAYDEGYQRHHFCQQVSRLILARHIMRRDVSDIHQLADVMMVQAYLHRPPGCLPARRDLLSCCAVDENPRRCEARVR